MFCLTEMPVSMFLIVSKQAKRSLNKRKKYDRFFSILNHAILFNPEFYFV